MDCMTKMMKNKRCNTTFIIELFFPADEKSIKHMFARENTARERYNQNVSQNIMDRDGLYDETDKK